MAFANLVSCLALDSKPLERLLLHAKLALKWIFVLMDVHRISVVLAEEHASKLLVHRFSSLEVLGTTARFVAAKIGILIRARAAGWALLGWIDFFFNQLSHLLGVYHFDWHPVVKGRNHVDSVWLLFLVEKGPELLVIVLLLKLRTDLGIVSDVSFALLHTFLEASIPVKILS